MRVFEDEAGFLCEGGRLECLVGLSLTRSTDQRL